MRIAFKKLLTLCKTNIQVHILMGASDRNGARVFIEYLEMSEKNA